MFSLKTFCPPSWYAIPITHQQHQSTEGSQVLLTGVRTLPPYYKVISGTLQWLSGATGCLAF